MLIRTNNGVKPHVNPTLRVGHLYEVVSSVQTPEHRVGRIFTVYNNPQNKPCIIYLAEEGKSGGWDDARILTNRGMNYKEIDLTFPTEQ